MSKFQKHIFFILIAFCMLNTENIYAQNELKLIKEISINANQLYSDCLGSIYAVDNNLLTKYDSIGNKLYTYTNYQYGKISSVDVNNPLKILVFYQDINAFILLDKTLSPTVDLVSLNDITNLTSLICFSYENDFWLYEASNSELIKIDKYINISQQTGNLNVALSMELNPIFMSEVNNTLYLVDAKQGILLFDRYGTFLKKYPFKDVKSVQVKQNQIYFMENNCFNSYNMKTLKHEILNLSEFNPEIVTFEGVYLYLYSQNKLKIFKFN